MHFSKELAEILLALPPELSSNAIEYRKLKKLIRNVVDELESLGLSPDVLQQLLEREQPRVSQTGGEAQDVEQSAQCVVTNDKPDSPRIVYEFSSGAGKIESRLRVRLPPRAEGIQSPASCTDSSDSEDRSEDGEAAGREEEDARSPGGTLACSQPDLFNHSTSLLYALQSGSAWAPSNEPSGDDARSLLSHGTSEADIFGAATPMSRRRLVHSKSGDDLFVSLQKDEEFYRLLYNALQSLAKYFDVIHDNFVSALHTLSTEISGVARPLSNTRAFHPHSNTTDPASISTSLFFRSPTLKSDLSAWRRIFQLYVESEIFESFHERKHGEHPVAEAEARLKAFSERVTSNGLGDQRTLKKKESRAALASFLRLNILLMDIKKFQFYNSEALRKILKKHAKRTALPHPLLSDTQGADQVTLVVPAVLKTLPRTLVQAVGEVLLPVIPHIDDYSCAICMTIAFKPIRLGCGHLFCVRCLVKMQKRGQDNCPMCRSPTVAVADRSNVDWALLNFLLDWFPEEAYMKLRANEEEATQEQLRELGVENTPCVIC